MVEITMFVPIESIIEYSTQRVKSEEGRSKRWEVPWELHAAREMQ